MIKRAILKAVNKRKHSIDRWTTYCRYSEMKDIPGLLLFVDFEKALDTLEWSFVKNVLSIIIMDRHYLRG